MNPTRRRVIGAFFALLTCIRLPSLAYAEPPENEAANIDSELDEFIRLSAVLTGTIHLDSETARVILGYVLAEPWGSQHLAQITPKFLAADVPSDTKLLFDKSRFNEGEYWFIGHLLTTWFCGIYYHEISHAVSYQYALMHTTITDVRPIPGFCTEEFGYWSHLPQGVHV